MEASIRPPKNSRPTAELLKVVGITLTSAGESTFITFQAFIMTSAEVTAGGDGRNKL